MFVFSHWFPCAFLPNEQAKVCRHILLNQSSPKFCDNIRNIYMLGVGMNQVFMGAKHHHSAGVFHEINIQRYSLSDVTKLLPAQHWWYYLQLQMKTHYAARHLGLSGCWDAVNNIQRPSAIWFLVLLFIYCSTSCRGKCVDVFSERPAEIKCAEC